MFQHSKLQIPKISCTCKVTIMKQLYHRFVGLEQTSISEFFYLIGDIEEHLHPILDGNFCPLLLGLQRGLDGLGHQLWRGVVKLGNFFVVIVRLKKQTNQLPHKVDNLFK